MNSPALQRGEKETNKIRLRLQPQVFTKLGAEAPKRKFEGF
jgi:hypothetical protein